MPRKAANTASANGMASSYETCCHSLFFLSHPLYFSQYLSNVEMESIQHLQCWFYFDMLATINISFQKCSSSFLALIYYFDFSPMVSLSGYNVCVCARPCMLSCIWLFVTPWTVTRQAPLSMDFSRQEKVAIYRSGLPFPPPGGLPHSRVKPRSPAPPALAGGFFTTESPGEPFEGQPPCKHFLASEYCSPVNGT